MLGDDVSGARGANLSAMAGYNLAVVLDRIRRSPDGVERGRLVDLTGLAAPSISNATRRLIEAGLIVETRSVPAGRGKPPMILCVRPGARAAVGVHIDPTFAAYAIVDFAGNVLDSETTGPLSATDPDVALRDVGAAINALIDRSGIDRRSIVGVGIGSPGPVDTRGGVILSPRYLSEWRHVAICDAVRAATGLPAVLDNDSNSAMVGELWTRQGQPDPSFAYAYFGGGFGLGVALEGVPVRGANGNAGYGGFLAVDTNQSASISGSRLIGHLASPEQLAADAIAAGARLETEPGQRPTFADLATAARAGHTGASAAIEQAGVRIADAIVSLIGLLDIDEVVFGGPHWPAIADLLLPSFTDRLTTTKNRLFANPIRITLPRSSNDLAALGAACLMFDTVYSPRSTSLLIGHR